MVTVSILKVIGLGIILINLYLIDQMSPQKNR